MRYILLLSAAVLAVEAISNIQAHAAGALAIGLPYGGVGKGFVYGYAPNRSDPAEAESKALNICRGIDLENNRVPVNASEAQKACAVVAAFRDQCGAVAHNGSQTKPATGIGWALALDRSTARRLAMGQCNAMRAGKAPACVIDADFCDGSGK